MESLDLIYASLFFGILIGFGTGLLWNKRRLKKEEKNAEEEIKKQDLLVAELGKTPRKALEVFYEGSTTEQVPTPQNLKPCLICGKQTTGDVCSMEHLEEWKRQNLPQNQTHLSEGSDQPKKEEVISGKEESSDTLTSSPDTSKEEKETLMDVVKGLADRMERIEKDAKEEVKKKGRPKKE